MVTSYYMMKLAKPKKLDLNEYYSDDKELIFMKNKYFNDKVCRVCLKEGFIPIYGNQDTLDLSRALNIFADIEVREGDDYPKHVCKVCYKFLQGASLFREIAKKSDEIMRRPVKEENLFEHSQDDDYTENFQSKGNLEDWSSDNFNGIKAVKKEKLKLTTKVTCHICNKVINRSYYKEHLTMHDPNHQKYVCDVCGKSFRLRCAYHNHSLRHRSDFPYKCQLCPYRGRYAELLKTHMRTHTGDYRYMCTECPARFLFKSNLNSHTLKHKEPQFKCDACKRAFHTNLMLRRHYEADHLGIKNHVCNLCGKAFGYRNAMMKHQRHVHKREKFLFGRMPSYLEAEQKHQNVG